MKSLRSLFVLLFMILLSGFSMDAQDLSKYRTYAFGMSVAELRAQLDSQGLRTKLIQDRPAIIQDVTWWPWESTGSSLRGEGLWQVLFRFHNGRLYRMLVIYDRHTTRGLTAEDMIEAISTQYGPAARPEVEVTFPTNGLYRSTEKAIAQWEDSQYSYTLFRSSLSDAFGLVMFSKQLDAQAELAIAESARLTEQEGPQKETARRNQEADDLEEARQKNKKAIRP